MKIPSILVIFSLLVIITPQESTESIPEKSNESKIEETQNDQYLDDENDVLGLLNSTDRGEQIKGILKTLGLEVENSTEDIEMVHDQTNTTIPEQTQEIDSDEYENKLINEFNLTSGTITRETYIKFIYRLFTKDEKIDESEEKMYRSVVDKLGSRVPEEFDTKDLKNYTDNDRLVEALDDFIGSEYGEEALKEIREGEDKYGVEDEIPQEELDKDHSFNITQQSEEILNELNKLSREKYESPEEKNDSIKTQEGNTEKTPENSENKAEKIPENTENQPEQTPETNEKLNENNSEEKKIEL